MKLTKIKGVLSNAVEQKSLLVVELFFELNSEKFSIKTTNNDLWSVLKGIGLLTPEVKEIIKKPMGDIAIKTINAKHDCFEWDIINKSYRMGRIRRFSNQEMVMCEDSIPFDIDL